MEIDEAQGIGLRSFGVSALPIIPLGVKNMDSLQIEHNDLTGS